MKRNLKLNVKTLDQIITDLLKERNLVRKIKSFFRPDKYHISKKLLISIRQALALNDNKFKINSNQDQLFYIIRYTKIPLKLKIDTFISLFYCKRNDFLNYESKLSSFLNAFIETFNDDMLRNHKSLNRLKIFLIELIGITKEKIKEAQYLNLINHYTSLLAVYYRLLKLGFCTNHEFWKEFRVFENIPKIYYPLKLFQLKIIYFKDILANEDKVKEVIFEFLRIYQKDLMKEYNTRLYPDPIKFCKFLENNFKSQIIDFYFEYYTECTTNFIPPLLLKRNKLNNPNVLKIIIKNLNNSLFDIHDIKNLYETLSNHKPKKNVFDLYCEVIISFKKQMFSFVISDIFRMKSLSLKEKYKMATKFYSKYPETKWDSFQLDFQSFLKNSSNKETLRTYLSLIITSENYEDFFSLCQNLFIFKTKELKKYGVVKYRKKYIKGLLKLLNTPKFNLLKQLFEIFKSNFYNIYKNNEYTSIEDFILKKFSSNSEKLMYFFFTHFSKIARRKKNSQFILNLYEEYNLFSSKVKRFKMNSDRILSFNAGKDIGDFQLDGDKILSLIRLGEKEELFKFIDENIDNEKSFKNPDYRLLALFEFLKGNYSSSKKYLEEEVLKLESYSKLKVFIDKFEDKQYARKKIQENNILAEIIEYELNLKERGSMNEVLEDLMKFLETLKNSTFLFGYFTSYDLYCYYSNLFNFFYTINSFHAKFYEKGSLYLNNFVRTRICEQWEDIYDLWKDLLPPSDVVHKINDYSKRQYEIFESNPIFTSIKIFLSNHFRRESNLSKIFNYKDLLKERYSDVTKQRIFWREVRTFVKNIEREIIYESGDLETIVQEKLRELLSRRFELVEAPKKSDISYKHIDILINNVIPIEIKKLDNTSKIDHGWGQIEVDFNIWKLNFGIELCIVEDLKKLKEQFLLREFIIGSTENICIIIK